MLISVFPLSFESIVDDFSTIEQIIYRHHYNVQFPHLNNNSAFLLSDIRAANNKVVSYSYTCFVPLSDSQISSEDSTVIVKEEYQTSLYLDILKRLKEKTPLHSGDNNE